MVKVNGVPHPMDEIAQKSLRFSSQKCHLDYSSVALDVFLLSNGLGFDCEITLAHCAFWEWKRWRECQSRRQGLSLEKCSWIDHESRYPCIMYHILVKGHRRVGEGPCRRCWARFAAERHWRTAGGGSASTAGCPAAPPRRPGPVRVRYEGHWKRWRHR